jgi:glycosyltransferase 2 family protein
MHSFRHLISGIKQVVARLKPYLRWGIIGATVFFISTVLHQHWGEVKTLRIAHWHWLALSWGITLLAHIWTGWVWSWILRALGQPASGRWSILVYLKTNIAKYLPGNVWHFYGRILAAKQAGIPVGAATLSVLLEPLLMAAAALILALLNVRQSWGVPWGLQLLCLIAVLLAIHPKTLNPLLQLAGRLKGKSEAEAGNPTTQISRYPVLPLMGEIGFVLLRGLGFLLTIQTLQPVSLTHIPAVLIAFSIAWLLGLVIPGAPGGIGVFEATAIALLDQQFPPSVILGSVALYRLSSTLAELTGAGLAYLAAALENQ